MVECVEFKKEEIQELIYNSCVNLDVLTVHDSIKCNDKCSNCIDEINNIIIGK